MLSFRSILLAAAAFATISSAIPTAPLMHNIPGVPSAPSGDLDDLFGGLGSGGGIVADIGELLAEVSGSDIIQTSRAAPAGLSTKRGTTSVGDIFKICSDGVELIVAKIDAAVNVEGGAKNVDHGLVKALLKEILVLLKVALKDLKVVAVAELTLNGVAKELAGVVAGLLIHVIHVVRLVLSIFGFTDVTLWGVIASIGVLLCELLEAVLVHVADLKAEVVVLIRPFVDKFNFALFSQILVILGIHV